MSPPADATVLELASGTISSVLDRPDAGQPLLLLGGLTRSLTAWDPLVAELDDRTVVRFDPPGLGASHATAFPKSIASLAVQAVEVLDALGLGCVDVLGFSHGGAVAQELAHLAPERVGSLILAATTCGMGSVAAGPEVISSVLRPEPGESIPRDVMAAAYRSFALLWWTSIPFLASLRCPTLVLSGDRDKVVPPVNAKILADRIPGASRVTLSAGHDLQAERVAPFLAAVVTEFLGAHAPSAGRAG